MNIIKIIIYIFYREKTLKTYNFLYIFLLIFIMSKKYIV